MALRSVPNGEEIQIVKRIYKNVKLTISLPGVVTQEVFMFFLIWWWNLSSNCCFGLCKDREKGSNMGVGDIFIDEVNKRNLSEKIRPHTTHLVNVSKTKKCVAQ